LREKNKVMQEQKYMQKILGQKSINFLIVDDDPTLLIILEQFILKMNSAHKIIKAIDGLRGLELFKIMNKIKNSNNIDIIISDIMMPNMNGYEMCTKIQSLIML
jgi:response regulator RpfG family c-di-GMP phosphodiesterase